MALVEVKKRIPATITGLVRSTAGGKPVVAPTSRFPRRKSRPGPARRAPSASASKGGTYTVNISAPGYLSQSKSVTVKDGDQAIFNVDLHPK